MRRRWQVDDLPMAHPSFGDDVIGELLHIFTGSLQDGDLHAALVVEVDVKRCLRKIMMIVETARQPFWQFALMVVVHINEGGDTPLSPRRLHCMLLQT